VCSKHRDKSENLQKRRGGKQEAVENQRLDAHPLTYRCKRVSLKELAKDKINAFRKGFGFKGTNKFTRVKASIKNPNTGTHENRRKNKFFFLITFSPYLPDHVIGLFVTFSLLGNSYGEQIHASNP
jgi:hypothetical protein